MTITAALRGIGGEFELNRVVGAFGATAYVVCANAFQAFEVFVRGHAFDLTAYCLSFPTGLGVAVGSVAGAVALKDRNVATARAITSNASAQTEGGQANAAS